MQSDGLLDRRHERGEMADKVVGLRIGADDYMTKPFDMMELMARVEALLRRSPLGTAPLHEAHRFGSVQGDLRRAEGSKDGQPVILSAREFQILRHLIDHRGDMLSPDELLTEVWGYEATSNTRTVTVSTTPRRAWWTSWSLYLECNFRTEL